MLTYLRSLPLLLLSLLLPLAGCGDAAVDPTYAGEPLVSLQGQMSAQPGHTVTGQVRLALVWFPAAPGGSEVVEVDALELVTEGVVYEGSFPLNYRFDIFQPPPAHVLSPVDEGFQGKAAFGYLVAFEDLDGNGKLDSIPITGTPVDRVIGSSMLEGTGSFFIVYVDSPQAAGAPLKAGFNVLMQDAQGEPVSVSSTSSLPITLTPGGDAYDSMVCEAGPLAFMFVPVCGLGEGEQPPLSHLGLSGEVRLEDGNLDVLLQASYDTEVVTDVVVTLDGLPLAYDAGRGGYALAESASTRLSPGASFVLKVSGRGEEAERTLQVPGAFTLTAPGEGAHLPASQPVSVAWTEAAGATDYYLSLDTPSAIVQEPAAQGAFAHTFDIEPGTGEGVVRVAATARTQELFDLFRVDVTTVQAQHFTLDP